MNEVRGKSGRMYRLDEYLFPDELADAMRRGRSYIFAAKAAGFVMPGGTNTVPAFREWLTAHPNFTTTNYIKKGKTQGPSITELDANFSG